MIRFVAMMLLSAVFGTALAATGSTDLYRDPNCGCCGAHAEYLRNHGFDVNVITSDNLAEVKAEHGVRDELASCHTAVIDGYVVEGHVPVDAIERMLEDQPEVTGIAVPGMPIGSPGMGMERGLSEPLQVWNIPEAEDESPSIHSTYHRIPR
ncbi:MAG: DUF411 domain-containing protein [Halofilum sp. (in: g-proteobacteria)]